MPQEPSPALISAVTGYQLKDTVCVEGNDTVRYWLEHSVVVSTLNGSADNTSRSLFVTLQSLSVQSSQILDRVANKIDNGL